MRFMVSATSNAAVELVGGGGSQSAIAQIFLVEVLSRDTHCSFPITATISSVPPEQSAERRRIFITDSIVALDSNAVGMLVDGTHALGMPESYAQLCN